LPIDQAETEQRHRRGHDRDQEHLQTSLGGTPVLTPQRRQHEHRQRNQLKRHDERHEVPAGRQRQRPGHRGEHQKMEFPYRQPGLDDLRARQQQDNSPGEQHHELEQQRELVRDVRARDRPGTLRP
jgi:hypothetical protein